MNQDVKIENENARFKYRVSGIVKVGNKYLTLKSDAIPFVCLAGGHVELGEDSKTAVVREMNEELGFEVKNPELLAVIEGFFGSIEGKKVHEIGFFYTVSPADDNYIAQDFTRKEMDKGVKHTHNFVWRTLEEMKAIDFRPSCILDVLETGKFAHIINKE